MYVFIQEMVANLAVSLSACATWPDTAARLVQALEDAQARLVRAHGVLQLDFARPSNRDINEWLDENHAHSLRVSEAFPVVR